METVIMTEEHNTIEKEKNPFFIFRGEVKNMTFDYVWNGIKHNLKVTSLNNKNYSPYVNKEIYYKNIKFFKPLAKALWKLCEHNRKISDIKM
jgi:hypothetical protein